LIVVGAGHDSAHLSRVSERIGHSIDGNSGR
jgi:hypothetical protein